MLKLFTFAQIQVYAALERTKGEDGQTMAEYAVVLTVIAAGILLALQFLGGGISNALNKVGSILP